MWYLATVCWARNFNRVKYGLSPLIIATPAQIHASHYQDRRSIHYESCHAYCILEFLVAFRAGLASRRVFINVFIQVLYTRIGIICLPRDKSRNGISIYTSMQWSNRVLFFLLLVASISQFRLWGCNSLMLVGGQRFFLWMEKNTRSGINAGRAWQNS